LDFLPIEIKSRKMLDKYAKREYNIFIWIILSIREYYYKTERRIQS